jgi:hypothetical protein
MTRAGERERAGQARGAGLRGPRKRAWKGGRGDEVPRS